MRRLLAAAGTAAVLVLAPIVAAPVVAADPVAHWVDHVRWAKWGDLNTLRVYPTAAARATSLNPGATAEGDQALAEVLAQEPAADQPGMRAQFLCHWQFAEAAQPGKTSWNLEPWRPEVSPDVMIASGCNPGGTEEPF